MKPFVCCAFPPRWRSDVRSQDERSSFWFGNREQEEGRRDESQSLSLFSRHPRDVDVDSSNPLGSTTWSDLPLRAGTVSFPCLLKRVLMIPAVAVESKDADFTQIQDKKVNVYQVLVLSANQSLRSRSTEDPLSCCCPILCCGHIKGELKSSRPHVGK